MKLTKNKEFTSEKEIDDMRVGGGEWERSWEETGADNQDNKKVNSKKWGSQEDKPTQRKQITL